MHRNSERARFATSLKNLQPSTPYTAIAWFFLEWPFKAWSFQTNKNMTEVTVRLRVGDREHRVRGVRVPHSGQLLLYATEALAVLLETTRPRACRHYFKLRKRAPELCHRYQPLGVCNHTQLFYRHGYETLATLDGLLRVAHLSRSPYALVNRIAFVRALCELFAQGLSRGAAQTISVCE